LNLAEYLSSLASFINCRVSQVLSRMCDALVDLADIKPETSTGTTSNDDSDGLADLVSELTAAVKSERNANNATAEKSDAGVMVIVVFVTGIEAHRAVSDE